MQNWNYRGCFPNNAEAGGVFYGHRGIISPTGNPLPGVVVTPASLEIQTYSDFTLEADAINTIAYKWQKSQDGATWADIPHETQDKYSYFVPHEEGAAGTTYYRVACYGLLGTVYSDVVAVNVTYRAPSIAITIDETGSFMPPHTATFISIQEFAESYQWYHSTDGETWDAIADATDSIYAVSYTGDDSGDHYYKCRASGLGGSVDSNVESITILHLPPEVSITTDKETVTTAETITITATATNADTITWYHSTDGTVWEEIAGEVNSTLECTYTEADAGDHYYMCRVIGLGGEAESEPVMITVNEEIQND